MKKSAQILSVSAKIAAIVSAVVNVLRLILGR
jgi:hypothetical protein